MIEINLYLHNWIIPTNILDHTYNNENTVTKISCYKSTPEDTWVRMAGIVVLAVLQSGRMARSGA